MSNPWDRPPLPTAGDASEDDTHLGIGRIIDTWEMIEFEMCNLMSILLGDRSHSAMRLYGEHRTFPGRMADFTQAAERYFVCNPHQEREGELAALTYQVEQFSTRRNEVAHSVVFQINRIEFYRIHLIDQDENRHQFAAVPPYHMIRSHDERGLPLYAYTLRNMTEMKHQMAILFDRLCTYREQMP